MASLASARGPSRTARRSSRTPRPSLSEDAGETSGALIARLHGLEDEGSVRIARRVEDVEGAVAGGPLAAIMHIEGAEALDPELTRLPELYETGLRSVGIVWSRRNA